MESVYCAVRTGSLSVIQVKFSVEDTALAQAVCRRPVTAETGFNIRSVRVRFVVNEVALARFITEGFSFPLSLLKVFHRCCMSFFFLMLLPEVEKAKAWDLPKPLVLWKLGSVGYKVYSLLAFCTELNTAICSCR
jgi:hypothetical protein